MNSPSLRVAVASLAFGSNAASPAVVRIGEAAFTPAAGVIIVGEKPFGETNPTYAPADFGGDAGAPTVTFGGFFKGRNLSATPETDWPGAAASACVVGAPTGPLSIDAGAPETFITDDGSNPTSPVLSGSPTFDGPIAVLFSVDQTGVGFDGGFSNAVGSTGIAAFARDGSLLGTVRNEGTGIEFLGFVSATGVAEIAGVFVDLVGDEPAGFGIDNLRFGKANEIILPPEVAPIPLPAARPMALVAIGTLAAVGRRRRA